METSKERKFVSKRMSPSTFQWEIANYFISPFVCRTIFKNNETYNQNNHTFFILHFIRKADCKRDRNRDRDNYRGSDRDKDKDKDEDKDKDKNEYKDKIKMMKKITVIPF